MQATGKVTQGQGGSPTDGRGVLGASAPRLDTPDTLRQQAAWRVTARSYPCGEAEISWAFRGTPPRRTGGRKRLEEMTPEERRRRDKENGRRALVRARAEVRRKLLTLSADHLTTFTVRENLQDRAAFLGLVARLLRGWKRLGLSGYVAVIEEQGRGALHLHVGTHGRVPVRQLRRLWWSICGGEGRGNIDVQGPRPGRAPWKMARYMSKYLTASPAREKGEKRYLCSQGIPTDGRVMLLRGHHPLEGAWNVLDWVQELTGKVGLVIVRDCGGWACSWGDHQLIEGPPVAPG